MTNCSGGQEEDIWQLFSGRSCAVDEDGEMEKGERRGEERRGCGAVWSGVMRYGTARALNGSSSCLGHVSRPPTPQLSITLPHQPSVSCRRHEYSASSHSQLPLLSCRATGQAVRSNELLSYCTVQQANVNMVFGFRWVGNCMCSWPRVKLANLAYS